MQRKSDPVGIIFTTTDGHIGHGVTGADLAQGSSQTNTVPGLEAGVDERVLLGGVVEVDVVVLPEGDIEVPDKEGIFKISMEIVLFQDDIQEAIEVIGRAQSAECAIGHFLAESIKTLPVMEIEVFQLFHIPIDKTVQDTLATGHDLVITDGRRIVGIDGILFREVVMVIRQFIRIV